MGSEQERSIPTRSPRFWGILVLLFAVIMVLTIWKDWWLTHAAPNVRFYVFVPIATILGGVVCMYTVAKISKQIITFSTMFAISLGANTLMQVVENITKIIYYRIWAYPGLFYVVLVIPLGFIMMVYGLMRWGKVKGWMAVVLTIFDFIGSMAAGVLLTDVVGLTTPGS